MTGFETEADSDCPESESTAMSDRSANKFMHIGSPSTVQLSGELNPTKLSLSSSSSITETFSSLTCKISKSNDQYLVTACTSGGSIEVNGCSLLEEDRALAPVSGEVSLTPQ